MTSVYSFNNSLLQLKVVPTGTRGGVLSPSWFFEHNSKTTKGFSFKVQMKCFFFIPEFERAAKIRKIAIYRFLISFLVPEL